MTQVQRLNSPPSLMACVGCRFSLQASTTTQQASNSRAGGVPLRISSKLNNPTSISLVKHYKFSCLNGQALQNTVVSLVKHNKYSFLIGQALQTRLSHWSSTSLRLGWGKRARASSESSVNHSNQSFGDASTDDVSLIKYRCLISLGVVAVRLVSYAGSVNHHTSC